MKRLRDTPGDKQLSRMYDVPHDHRRWPDHLLRVGVTSEMIRWLAGSVASAADLSCGNGTLLNQTDAEVKYYGDLAPGWPLNGSIEQTLQAIPRVDLFICSETIEHLDDPAGVLTQIRKRTKKLVLSTPVDAWDDSNLEHLWAWSRNDVERMLKAAGFEIAAYVSSDARPRIKGSYLFGVWGCQ